MKYNALKDHGLVVWAKLKRNDKPWAAMIISAEKLDLQFKESSDKLWVWWLGDNRFSQVPNKFIEDFCTEFVNNARNLKGLQKKGVLEALDILSIQYDLKIPNNSVRADVAIQWGIVHLKNKTQNKIGKLMRAETYFIPDNILKKITRINNNNIKLTIKHNINENIPVEKKGKTTNSNDHKGGVNKALKMKNNCLACRKLLGDHKHEHPLIKGFICDECFKNVGLSLMPTQEKYKNNVDCCICFSTGETSIFCDHCIRTFCKDCLSIYCDHTWLFKVLNQRIWQCFLCDEALSNNASIGLKKKMTREQIKNIYNLYSSTKKSKEKIKISEIMVIAENDDEAIVPTILNSLKFPFNIFKSQNDDSHSIIQYENIENDIILLIQLTKDISDESIICEFMKYASVRSKLKAALRNSAYGKNKHLFWAFESSASISKPAHIALLRFSKAPPILIGTNHKDVCQRSRFIWSNIPIPTKHFVRYQKSNIFLRKLEDDDEQNFLNYGSDFSESTSISSTLGYDSVKIILTSLIKNMK